MSMATRKTDPTRERRAGRRTPPENWSLCWLVRRDGAPTPLSARTGLRAACVLRFLGA
jgi:hypothetical protein